MLKVASGYEKRAGCRAWGKLDRMGILIPEYIKKGQRPLSKERDLVMAAGAEEIYRRLT
jgi:hypothetical protein